MARTERLEHAKQCVAMKLTYVKKMTFIRMSKYAGAVSIETIAFHFLFCCSIVFIKLRRKNLRMHQPKEGHNMRKCKAVAQVKERVGVCGQETDRAERTVTRAPSLKLR